MVTTTSFTNLRMYTKVRVCVSTIRFRQGLYAESNQLFRRGELTGRCEGGGRVGRSEESDKDGVGELHGVVGVLATW